MKISEMIKELQMIQNKSGDIDVYIHDSNDGTDVFDMSIYTDEAPTEIDVDYAVIGIASDIDGTVARKCFKVEMPNGYLMVEAKGTVGEYPGVYISYSKDGNSFDVSNIIVCTEYCSCDKEIKTETYRKDFEEPTRIVCWKDGREIY